MSASPVAARSLRILGRRDVNRVTLADLPAVRAHALTNELYGASGLRVEGLVWFWQAGWPSRIQEWISFAAEGSRLQLALDGDMVGLDPRQIDWRNYEGDTQLLAWTACHEPLINLLRVMFQCDWVPESIGDCDCHEALDADCVRVGFAVHRADGLAVVQGALIMDASSAQRLAARERFTVPRGHQPMRSVRARLPLVVDEFDVEASELGFVSRGSLIRLDNRTLLAGPARLVIPAGHVQWIVDLTEARATVVGFAAHDSRVDQSRYSEGDTMSIDRPEEQSAVEAPVAVGALPVRITFCAGRLTLPFSQVSDVGPGYVFELDRRLDDQAITVHANDVPIAVGELVSLGDLVGVRITRMLPGA
jgi:type III secretion system YscQ/HrcQ family protein